MPGPTSSNDLFIELTREMLAERGKDLNDGLSVRSLNRMLSDHAAADEKKHDKLEERIRKLEEGVARHEGAADTGRFQLPPAQQLPAVSVNLNGGKSSKRPSAFLGAVTKDPKLMGVLIALLTVLAHAILRLLK